MTSTGNTQRNRYVWLLDVMLARGKSLWRNSRRIRHVVILSDATLARGKSLWRNSRKICHVVNFRCYVGSWKIFVKKLTQNSSRCDFQMQHWLVENPCEETRGELFTLWISDVKTLTRGTVLYGSQMIIRYVGTLRHYSLRSLIQTLT